MEILERYLDQVCRGIAGPRAMRQHIRQELREHLLDAAAQHRAAGMSEQDALASAIEDFGGPDQVRSELEATHGHRLMAVVIDKAMQWKERTMKAKWLFSTWAHLALAIVILGELAIVCGAMVFVVPKFNEFVRVGWLQSGAADSSGIVTWAHRFLFAVATVMQGWLWWVIPLVILWVLFEWLIRSENKTLIRLAVMATAAAKLLVVVGLTSAALTLPFFIELPLLNKRAPEPAVREAVGLVDAFMNDMSNINLERVMIDKNWDSMQRDAATAQEGLTTLDNMGAAASTLVAMREQAKLDEMRKQIASARRALQTVRGAIAENDMPKLILAMKDLQAAYNPIRSAAAPTTQPAK